jgi:hypothetical protein
MGKEMKFAIPSEIDFDDFNNLPNHDDITEIESDSHQGRKIYPDIWKCANLEKFEMTNLQMPAENWIQMAKNCTKLKDLCFNYTGPDIPLEGFQALMKMPSLEKLVFIYTNLPCWIEGPSNLKVLHLHAINDEDDFKNISLEKHEHLEELELGGFDRIKDLQLEKCLNLTTIKIVAVEEERLYEAIEKIMLLPKLKTLIIHRTNLEYLITPETIDSDVVFPSIETLDIRGCYEWDDPEKPEWKRKRVCGLPRRFDEVINRKRCPNLTTLWIDGKRHCIRKAL